MNFDYLTSRGFRLTEDYYYDETHHSAVFFDDLKNCVIIDIDLCDKGNGTAFDYSKYCEMQNKWMTSSKKLYRFYLSDTQNDETELITWLDKDPDSIEVNDKGGSFDKAHIDNTPLEKGFEDLFTEAYGNDSVNYLQKEYSLSLNEGRNAFVDYVLETDHGSFAIEENGVHYHHPQIIGEKQYKRQLEKQNTLSLYGFKTYRFSFENLRFKDQAIDNIRSILGEKRTFHYANLIGATRGFRLYTHHENILHQLEEDREKGSNTSLVVCPTGAGKSQIAIEDIHNLYRAGKIKRALIMVPSKAIRNDWEERLKALPKTLKITCELYNRTFLSRSQLPPDYYDYILFDEAQHAQAANCAKTLQYFNPDYLLGLTATPERLDHKKLEDIFGQYKTQLTLKEAIEKDVISNAWANDFDENTCKTYRKNICPDKPESVICEDVHTLNIDKLGPIDGFAFGFPCNDFSVVGEQKGFEGTYGPLYTYGVKVLKKYQPLWFLAENVGGLSSANEGKAFEIIKRDLDLAGYRLYPNLYKFEDYGIPQARHRIIIVGIRKDLPFEFKIPKPSMKMTTCKEAIENPPIAEDAENNEMPVMQKQTIERLKYIKPGQNAFNADIPDELKLNVKGAKISQIYKRLDPEKPAYTVTGSGGGGTHIYHWEEPRALTNRERARLQTFPDEFVFEGPKESVRKQIGMAVPAKGAQIIFEAILKTFAGEEYEWVEGNISE